MRRSAARRAALAELDSIRTTLAGLLERCNGVRPSLEAAVDASRGARPIHVATPQKDDLLAPKAAAKVLGVTEYTLNRWRCTGRGPRYAKLSARMVRYRRSDLDAWTAENLHRSTAEGM